MKVKARLELRLTRELHGALSLREIQFFPDGSAKPLGHFADRRAQTKAPYPFNWNGQPAMRALAVLVLRHFAPGAAREQLEGGNGSLAASLHEVVTAVAPDFWFKKLWLADTQPKVALPKSFFDGTGNTHEAHYVVFLGETLASAELLVWIEKRKVEPANYQSLADELDPLHGELIVKVRKGGAGGWLPVAECGLPITPRDHLRISARVNRWARLCVIWIGSSGRVSVVHPLSQEKPGEWPATWPNGAQKEFTLPDSYPNAGPWYAVGEPGAETFVLLAAEEKETPAQLSRCFHGLPAPIPYRSAKTVVTLSFHASPPGAARQTAGRPAGNRDHGDLLRPMDPLEKLQATLARNLAGCCRFACGVSVPSRGGALEDKT